MTCKKSVMFKCHCQTSVHNIYLISMYNIFYTCHFLIISTSKLPDLEDNEQKNVRKEDN